MSNYNKVIIMGRLTRDPELRQIPSGTAVSDIGLAVNQRAKRGEEWIEEATFIDVTLWGRQAELASQYLTKGRQCLIEGRLQMDTWEDKQTGQKRSKLKVVGENVQFIGSREDNHTSPPRSPSHDANWNDDEEEDIPF